MTEVTCARQLSLLAVSQEMAETMNREEKQKTQGTQYWIVALDLSNRPKSNSSVR